jgi:hypothetical protein
MDDCDPLLIPMAKLKGALCVAICAKAVFITLRRKIAAKSEVRDIFYSQLSNNDEQAREALIKDSALRTSA